MPRPIVATKLYAPKPRPGLVKRPRLGERLHTGAGSRLMLVSAPAGFGKTTILAEWLAETAGQDRIVAWLSLDKEDSEPAAFWTCVVAALRAALSDEGRRAVELLAATPDPVEHLLIALLNDLTQTPSDVWLVLDDYHLVDCAEVSLGLVFFLEHLPPRVHVVLSTRADPDLPLSRWRGRGELAEIRAADLRFTSDEATAYFNDVAGLDLAAADVAALEERTEGWIAALQLAALSLQGRDDVSRFIARFAGDDRYIVDYLVEEVLRHQPEPIRTFLMQTAILDRLTGSLCDSVTGRDDSNEMLVTLERANIFIVPLDDRREWYRYHHLFADVLRMRMLAEQPDLVPVLHQRASEWFERHEDAEDAVGHALAARDFDRSVYLMEMAIPEIRRTRREAMLLGWLKALPDENIRFSPVLSVFYGFMSMVSGNLDAVEPRFDDAERALASAQEGATPNWAETDELRTLPATIAVYRASLAQARGDVAGTTEHARRALELAGPADHLSRGSAAGFLALTEWVQGDVSSALETFALAVDSLHAAGALVDALSSTVVLADMWRAAGRPSKAARLYQRALKVAEEHGDPMARASVELYVGLSEIDLDIGDLESARRHLDKAAHLGAPASMIDGRYRWFVATGRLADAEGDPEGAISLLDQAAPLFRAGFFPEVRPIAAMRARIQIRQGDLTEAADWASGANVSDTEDAAYLKEFVHLTLVRLLVARYRRSPDDDSLVRAEALLERLLHAAETADRAGSILEIRMLQALADYAQGRRLRARETLARALAHSPEPAAHVRLFVDEGAPMMALLRDVADHGVGADHARRLLAFAHAGEGASPGRTAPGARSMAGSLSDRERQVLRLLDSELTGPQIAGELFVSHNTLRTHTKHIFTKLEVTSRRAAVVRARELGLI